MTEINWMNVAGIVVVVTFVGLVIWEGGAYVKTQVDEIEARETEIRSAIKAVCVDAGGEYLSSEYFYDHIQITCGINGSLINYRTFDDGKTAWRIDGL